MKLLNFRVVFTIFVAIVQAILVALIWMRARERHNASYIQGIVVDVTPNLSQENLTKLEMAAERKSENEFSQILQGMYETSSPVPNATVTAKGDSVTKKTNTDSQGKFKFTGLPSGDYEISAEVSSGARSKRMATVKPVKAYLRGSTLTASVQVPVRSDLVTIRGRILDAAGNPIAGANVRGEPFPMPESAEVTPPTQFAVSGADGSYELNGFRPNSIYRIAGYLAGGDPTRDDAGGSNIPFYIQVHVEADGFEQDKTKIPEIPLVTEELLGPARRLLDILRKLEMQLKGTSELSEKKGVFLPPSEGNVITGIDIVLTKQAAVR